jgi:hypothetical protein
LKASPRLVIADYTGAHNKELARQVNDLTSVCKDLIRLVRGMAAEDQI